MKRIRFSEHALSYRERRGFSEAEVYTALETEPWESSEKGGNRLQCSKTFSYNKVWNGKHYLYKKVRPIFVEEPTEIIVITVYTYYY